MRRTTFVVIVALVAVASLGVMAAVAGAQPSYSTCTTCHSGSGVSVQASESSSDATTTTYDVAVTGGTGTVGWAVFSGSTNVKNGTGTTGSFTVNDGSTYTVYAVNYKSGMSDGVAQTTVSPASQAPKPTQDGTDTTPPVTTSDVSASYTGQAVITLSATDTKGASDTGCWGVAYIYYKLDPGMANDGNPADGGYSMVTAFTTPVFTGTVQVTVPGPAAGSGKTATHTIEYWSQDAAGNVEMVATTKTFTIVAARATSHLTVSVTRSVKLHQTVTVKGALTPASLGGNPVSVVVQRKHGSKWVTAKSAACKTSATGAYSYRYKPAVKGSYRVQSRISLTAAHTAAKTAWRSFTVK